jgi:hypothetical protein
MVKYKRKYSFESIVDTSKVKATNCNSFSFYNAGNVNVTINRVLVLQPGDSWPKNNDDINIEDDQDFHIEFNIGADVPRPIFQSPVPGVDINDANSIAARLIPFDTRLILIKTHLSIV